LNPVEFNPATGHAYLYAAYGVVWVVHCLYAFTLVSRGKRLQREARELNRR
jgi:CcmD family protein